MADNHIAKIEAFLGELAGDKTLSDEDYMDVMDELIDRACAARLAKAEEMQTDEPPELLQSNDTGE